MDGRTLTLTQSFASAAARRGSAFRAKFLRACDGMPYRELAALVEQEYREFPFLPRVWVGRKRVGVAFAELVKQARRVHISSLTPSEEVDSFLARLREAHQREARPWGTAEAVVRLFSRSAN
jgi:hypothetical protein